MMLHFLWGLPPFCFKELSPTQYFSYGAIVLKLFWQNISTLVTKIRVQPVMAIDPLFLLFFFFQSFSLPPRSGGHKSWPQENYSFNQNRYQFIVGYRKITFIHKICIFLYIHIVYLCLTFLIVSNNYFQYSKKWFQYARGPRAHNA